MKVTPLEIRQKSFEKNFRGYDKDEVNAFLLTLSQEWERIIDENKELRIKLESAEREVLKLREVENSLFKTLKTAEDTGANVIEQARHTAHLHVKESQLKSETVLNDARQKAKTMIDEADARTRKVIADMEERVKALAEAYKKLEAQRDTLLTELKHLAEDTMERIARARKDANGLGIDERIAGIKEDLTKSLSPNGYHEAEATEEVEKSAPAEDRGQPELVEATQRTRKSFFDGIG